MDPITNAFDIRVLAGLALALAAGFGAGYAVCRQTARVTRVRRLQRELDAVAAEHRSYRDQVADHFDATSRHLRELTLQFRNVYRHLTDGAHALCSEHAARLDADPEPEAWSPVVGTPQPPGAIPPGDEAAPDDPDRPGGGGQDTRSVPAGDVTRGGERRGGESHGG